MAKRRRFTFRDAATPFKQIFSKSMKLANGHDCVGAARDLIQKSRMVPLESSRHAQEAYTEAAEYVSKKCPKSSFRIARSNIEHAEEIVREDLGLTPLKSSWEAQAFKKAMIRGKKPSDERLLREIFMASMLKPGRKATRPAYQLRKRGTKVRVPVYFKKRGEKVTTYVEHSEGRGHANAGKKRNRKKKQ